MSGPASTTGQDESRGLNYRALDDLFRLSGERGVEAEFSIHVQVGEMGGGYWYFVRNLCLLECGK